MNNWTKKTISIQRMKITHIMKYAMIVKLTDFKRRFFMFKKILIFGLIILIYIAALSQTIDSSSKIVLPLNSVEGLDLRNVKAEVVEHQGKKGLRVIKSNEDVAKENRETLIIISDVNFKNGTIEIELAGEPAPDADPQARGFIGVAFRLAETDPLKYECFYVRPTNGRANDQLRRNHTTQYVSHPDFPWYRLRKENPGVYESYVDLVPGEWTKIKVVVSGKDARLYVHNAEQPCLVVKDLKLGGSEGKIALWLHWSTLAHFRNLVVTTIKN